MGSFPNCCGCGKPSDDNGTIRIGTKFIKTEVDQQRTVQNRSSVLLFCKKPGEKDAGFLFPVSSITLNQALLNQFSTNASEISVCVEGSEIVSDEASIISTSTRFLERANQKRVQKVYIHKPQDFDIVSRMALFRCLAHSITHFEAKIDLQQLSIKKIIFCWNRDELIKFYQWDSAFIEVNTILIHPEELNR